MNQKESIKKTEITHPVSGTVMMIDTAIYKPFKAAIIQCLKKTKGKTFTELVADVKKIIKKTYPAFKGSVSWYTISVLHNLQTEGIAIYYKEKGKKYNCLT